MASVNTGSVNFQASSTNPSSAYLFGNPAGCSASASITSDTGEMIRNVQLQLGDSMGNLYLGDVLHSYSTEYVMDDGRFDPIFMVAGLDADGSRPVRQGSTSFAGSGSRIIWRVSR